MIVYVRQSFLFDDSVFLGSWLSSFFFESRNQAFFGDSPSFKKDVASFREKTMTICIKDLSDIQYSQ